MILLIILTTCAMAFYTNRPFALAPGLGSVGIVASMISNEGISAPVAAGVIFWSGVLFILISFLGLREAVVRTIPVSLKQAVSAGIGLFIALLGAKNCGLIVADADKNNLAFGDLASPSVIVAVIGFIILLVIRTRNVPGGMILAILITTVIGIPFGVTELPSSPFSLPAGIGSQFMNIDFIGALDFAYIPFLIALFIPDFFSTFGTVLGVGAKAGYLDEDGNLPGIDKCFKVDAIATSFGALFGMPSMTTYLESSAATGPILIFIGINMLSSMSKIHYEDLTEAVPAFICIVFTIFANNIANGICAAIPAYFIMKIAAGKVKELSPVMYIMVAVCLLYFYTLI